MRLVETSAPVHAAAPAPTVWIAGNSFPTTLTRAFISQACAALKAVIESAPTIDNNFEFIFKGLPSLSDVIKLHQLVHASGFCSGHPESLAPVFASNRWQICAGIEKFILSPISARKFLSAFTLISLSSILMVTMVASPSNSIA